MPGPYSMAGRAAILYTNPLSHQYQYNPTSRFLWIDKPEYTPPTSVGPAKTMATKGKPGAGRVFRSPQRHL